MSVRTRGLAVAALAATAATLFVPSPALADRCEPTELVVRFVDPSYEEPPLEQDSPVCYVLLNYGYYYLCVNGAQGMACFTNPNPGVRPVPSIAPFNPQPGRSFCALYVWAHDQLEFDYVECDPNNIV